MLYVKQVSPDQQISPYEHNEYENIYIFGNKRFFGRDSGTIEELEDALSEIYSLITGDYCNFYDIPEILSFYMPRLEKYSREERKHAATLAKEYREYGESNDIYCELLSMQHNKKFDWRTIRGDCQSDWQYLIYSEENDPRIIEIEYFNTGTEWIIHDDETTPEGPEDISGYSIYCYSYDPVSEIAEYIGEKIENIIAYEFNGYSHIAMYKQIYKQVTGA